MRHLIERVPAFAGVFWLCAVAAQAQSFSASAIDIDIAAGDAGGEPILITAYQPQLDIAPRFAASGGDIVAVAFDPQGGLPTPSIILGRVEPGQEEAFGIETLLPDTVAQIGFAYDDIAARRALRAENPVLFEKLVSGGHIDPPVALLNTALQSELARMGCYRSGIDGAWGPGSRRSVSAYMEEASGLTWPDNEPSMSLFRAIALREDVTCPAPVAAVAAPSRPAATRSAAPSRTAATPTRRAAPARKPAPKPQPTAKPRISTGAGIGVFR